MQSCYRCKCACGVSEYARGAHCSPEFRCWWSEAFRTCRQGC
nr:MAG TPA: hypothetical protein [Caudoviricetes sp.]